MAIDFADLAVRVNYSDVPKATRALEELSAASGKAEQATNRVGVSSVTQTRNMGAWSAIQAEATGRVGEHSLAIGRLGYRLESMASEALGANSAVGLLGASFLKFGVGDIYSVAILGGLYAIVKAYDFFTEGSTKAREEADKMTKSLVDQARAARAATVAGAENLKLIQEIQLQSVKKESGVGLGSIFMSLLTGKPTISAGDAEAQSKRIADAQTGVDQATQNVSDAVTKAAKEAQAEIDKQDAAFQKHIDVLIKGLVFDDQRKQITAELTGIEHQLTAEVNRGTDSVERRTTALERLTQIQDALARKFLVPGRITSPEQLIGIVGDGETAARRFGTAYGGPMANVSEVGNAFIRRAGQPDLIGQQIERDATSPLIKHAEAVEKLNQRYDEAVKKFSSMSSALDDFKMGLKEGVTALLNQFSPGALAQNLVGGLVSQVDHFVSGLASEALGGIRHAIFGQSGAERTAQREAADSAHAMALSIDEVTKSLGHDALGAAIDALQVQLISTLHAIDQALPGTKNEAERNRLRAEAAAQEQQQEAKAAHQDALNKQYAAEDLQVRNLRATGQGSAADLLAFKDQQAREMQQAIDDGRDATYLNTLATVQNNELIAFLNGTLQDATRNNPTGFFANAYYSQFATPRGADPFNTGMPAPNSPSEPAGTGAASGSGLKPPGSRGAPRSVTIPVVLDGKVLTTVVVRNIDQYASSTSGSGTSRSDALNRMPS